LIPVLLWEVGISPRDGGGETVFFISPFAAFSFSFVFGALISTLLTGSLLSDSCLSRAFLLDLLVANRFYTPCPDLDALGDCLWRIRSASVIPGSYVFSFSREVIFTSSCKGWGGYVFVALLRVVSVEQK